MPHNQTGAQGYRQRQCWPSNQTDFHGADVANHDLAQQHVLQVRTSTARASS